MSQRDDLLYEIFSAPVEEFTATRNRIAKETKDKALAKEIKSLKKPTLSAWVVNQLARERSADVEALVDLHERLSGADPKEMRTIAEERRKLIAKLTEHAGRILERGGHSASSTTLQRVSQTLLAASAGENLEALSAGTLSTDLESQGFGALEGFDIATESAPYDRATEKARERAEELDRKAREAEAEAADVIRVAEAAQRDAVRLTKEAEAAAKRAEQARKRADDALGKLGGG